LIEQKSNWVKYNYQENSFHFHFIVMKYALNIILALFVCNRIARAFDSKKMQTLAVHN